MKSSTKIPSDLTSERAWQNLVTALKPGDVKVTVKNGVVTLRGIVDLYSKKVAAEKITEAIPGVIAIANEIVVVPKNVEKNCDDKIAHEILLNIIHHESDASDETDEAFTMKIKNQWLYIEGKVENNHGEVISVEGAICKLQEKTDASAHKNEMPKEMAYWEFFQ